MKRLFPLLFVLAAACGDDSSAPPLEVGELSLTTAEDTPITQALPITGDDLTITFSTPAHGTLTPHIGASVTYTPDANYNGTDDVTVTIRDGADDVTKTLSITVTPVNDAPVAVDDALAGQRNVTLVAQTSALLANDSDVDGDTLSVTAVSAASMGTVALAGGTVTYTPPAGYAGVATFTYTVSDGTVDDTATVTITVTGDNAAPVAVDDTATTLEDTALALTSATLVANDTDADGQTLSVMSVSGATHGTVVLAANVATFTPEANYNGTATFDYVVTDGSATDTGTVTITVTPVNDAPVANDDVASTPRNTALALAAGTLLANDTDVDGPTLTISAVSAATNGTVALAGTTVTFTPAAGFVGAASFVYTVTDGTLTDTATVMVNVTTSNVAPVAVDDTRTTAEDTALAIATADLVANDTDGDGDALMVTAVANPTHGTVAIAAGTITFTPAANYNGAASFEYTVSDGTATDVGVVAITVTPVNDAPVAVDDTASTTVSTAAVIAAATLVANDTDVDLDALTVASVSNPTNGTVTLSAGSVTFTPTTGFTGTATFEYVVTDGTASDTGLVTVTVTAAGANTAPIAIDDTATTLINTNLVVTRASLLANDTDPDPQTLTVTAVAAATNGTVVLGATDVTFTPTAGFVGTAGFDYTVSDGVATDVGHVTITVTTTDLVLFNFDGAAGTEVTQTPASVNPLLMSPVTFTRGSGVSPSAASMAFGSSGWNTTVAIDLMDYVTFTLTPAASHTLTLQSLKFDLQRSGSGPDSWAVRSSIDNFATDVTTGGLATSGSFVSFTVPLGATFANLTTPVTFRIYGYHSGGGAGTLRQDNVRVAGTVGP